PLQVGRAHRSFVRRGHWFYRRGVVGGVNRANLPNGAIVNALEKFAPRIVVSPTESSNQGQILLPGQFDGLEHGPQPGRIGRHRLLTKDVFASLNSGAKV